jgi:hypothetical protein
VEHHHLFRQRPLAIAGEAGDVDEVELSTRSVYGYRAEAYNTRRGSVFGYLPELNVLCALADRSDQSGQPLTKQLIVEVMPASG